MGAVSKVTPCLSLSLSLSLSSGFREPLAPTCETWRREGSLSLVRERVAGGTVCMHGEDGKALSEGTLIVVGIGAKDPRKMLVATRSSAGRL